MAQQGVIGTSWWIPVGNRNHRKFTRDDIKVIAKIEEYQKQGFVLKVAAKQAMEKLNIRSSKPYEPQGIC